MGIIEEARVRVQLERRRQQHARDTVALVKISDFLDQRTKPPRLKELAYILDMTPSGVRTMLLRLEKQGRIRRRWNSKTFRISNIDELRQEALLDKHLIGRDAENPQS